MKHFSRTALLTAAFLIAAVAANGQTAAPEAKPVAVDTGATLTVITPEKKKLIGDLLMLMNVEKDFYTSIDQAMTTSSNAVGQMLDKLTPSPNGISAKDIEAVTAITRKSLASMQKKARERMPNAINVRMVIDEIFYPLYDKYYTEAELKDLIAFYQTPTGKKTIGLEMEIMAEAGKMSNEKITPLMTTMMEKIFKEEMDSAKKEIDAVFADDKDQ
jgi:hypothetical protein